MAAASLTAALPAVSAYADGPATPAPRVADGGVHGTATSIDAQQRAFWARHDAKGTLRPFKGERREARAWFRAEHAVLTSAVEQSLASVPDALRTAVVYTAAETDPREVLAWAETTNSALRLHMSGVLLALVLRATGRVGESEAAMARAELFAGDPDDPASSAGFARFVARLHVAVGADQPPSGLPLMTPLMRRVDAHGTSLVNAEGVVRLGAALSGLH
ncbi:hypothetical protein ACF09C_29295 [Streptomyces sp. NPDC014870]|uniref:hypothetical protein n=1 Tax=Streptomyces sp. NPDC014870 TaxID=3364925 RepID=UPI0036FF105A